MKRNSIKIKNTVIIIWLCMFFINCIVPLYSWAGNDEDNNVDFNDNGESITIGEVGGYLQSNVLVIERLNAEMKFSSPTGHGFAAERGNNLIDVLKGNRAIVIGDNNAKNGADRIIINRKGTILIQDKYYEDPVRAINECFDSETGLLRYVDANGNPMQIEVPCDQYEKAITEMEKKIREGKVPGISDPAEARNIIRKGNLTYKQARNIAKAGNIDSLAYDAANGCVYAASAFGLCFVLDYAICRLYGEDNSVALRSAAINGLKTGGLIFATSVIASQLSKTGVSAALKPTAEAITRSFGPEVAKVILESQGISAVGLTQKQIIDQTTKVIQNKMLTNGVLFVALVSFDAIDLFRGRISKEQFISNIAVVIGGLAGAEGGALAGAALGGLIVPGAGAVVGGIIGGIGGGLGVGMLTDYVAKQIYAGDAELMYGVIEDTFVVLCEDYMLTEEEGERVISEMQQTIIGVNIKDMYESDDHEQYAMELMEPIFEDVVSQRETIELPSEESVRFALKQELVGVVLIH